MDNTTTKTIYTRPVVTGRAKFFTACAAAETYIDTNIKSKIIL
jgi:hypothetical protein